MKPEDFRNFTSAVIDAKVRLALFMHHTILNIPYIYTQSFKKISGYLEYAKSSDEVTVLAGGTADDRYIHYQ